MIDWSFEVENKVTPSEKKMSVASDYVVCAALLNLCDDLKIEMKDQEISRSMRKYTEELLEAAEMVINHYTAPFEEGKK